MGDHIDPIDPNPERPTSMTKPRKDEPAQPTTPRKELERVWAQVEEEIRQRLPNAEPVQVYRMAYAIMAKAVRKSPPREPRKRIAFWPEEIGGAFDGVNITSDADPGL